MFVELFHTILRLVFKLPKSDYCTMSLLFLKLLKASLYLAIDHSHRDLEKACNYILE